MTYIVQFIISIRHKGKRCSSSPPPAPGRASEPWPAGGRERACSSTRPTTTPTQPPRIQYPIEAHITALQPERIRVTPSLVTTDVGVIGDNVSTSHLFGVDVLPNTEWSSITSVDGRTVRYTTNTMANL